jgi:hypothetical protein
MNFENLKLKELQSRAKQLKLVLNQVFAKKILNYEYKPKYLIADAAGAITSGFAQVYGENYKRIMCWFHMKKAVENSAEYKSICADDRDKLMIDLTVLQKAESEEIFSAAFILFKRKWKKYDSFFQYFEPQWINQLPGWYEGFATCVPSTNNALESFNRVIKDQKTMRERLPLKQFLHVLEKEMVAKWSASVNENTRHYKAFATEIQPTVKLMKKAYQLHSSDNLQVLFAKNEGLHYIGSKEVKACNFKLEIQSYREKKRLLKWKNFDEYTQCTIKMNTVRFINKNWRKSECSCGFYQKNYTCKHILALAIRYGCCHVPNKCKPIKISKKKSRGRKKKATKALWRQVASSAESSCSSSSKSSDESEDEQEEYLDESCSSSSSSDDELVRKKSKF